MNDYGQTQLSREDEFEHQRFSLATFVGVNFPLVKAYFAEGSAASGWSRTAATRNAVSTRAS